VPSPPDALAATRIDRRGWWAMALASASYVTILDNLGLAVAFPTIEAAYPTYERTTLAWVSSGYAVALASLLLVGGRMADRWGRRRLYRIGMIGFALAAAASAAAPNPWFLIASRAVQGAAGAAVMASALALALPLINPARRGVAMGWLGVAGSLASLLGPLVAGNLLAVSSWRVVFCITPPICVAAWWGAPRVFDADRPDATTTIDVVGAIMATTAVAAATLSITQSARLGLASPFVVGCGLAAILLAVAFVRRCRTAANPLLRLHTLRRRAFSVATASQLFTQLTIFAWFFSIPLFLQNEWGWSPSRSGWIITVAMAMAVNSVFFGSYADRKGYRPVLVWGGVCTSAGMVLWLVMLQPTPSWLAILPGLMIFGWGTGMVGMTSTAAALDGIAAEDLAMANATHQTARRLVQTLGTALAVAVLGNRDTAGFGRYQAVWLLVAAGYLLSGIVALAYPDRD